MGRHVVGQCHQVGGENKVNKTDGTNSTDSVQLLVDLLPEPIMQQQQRILSTAHAHFEYCDLEHFLFIYMVVLKD